MPLQRRLPKVGFRSKLARSTGEVRLNELAKVDGDVVDMAALYAADVLPMSVTRAKVILSGELSRAVTVRGLRVTKGARAAIEAAGGKVED
jgi:large subunit ribosomal protein L15